ncbi:MAG: DUF885 domain-containing protein [Pseudomonadota bacterium]
MLKTKIALAVMLAVFALTPAAAAPKKPAKGKAKASKVVKTKATRARAPKALKAAKGRGKQPAVVAAPEVSRPVAAPASEIQTPERRLERQFNATSIQFLNALWRVDPEGAIAVGKYESAANVTIPNEASRAQKLAFINEWLQKFARFDTSKMSAKQRTDHALVVNQLESERWQLTTYREFEWNPAMHNIAAPIDMLMNSEYAAKPQRLRTILKRLAVVPAFYSAAQASIVRPTREHTQLALQQAPGTLVVLADLGKAAQDSILTAAEKTQFAQRIAQAGNAVVGYANFLTELERTQQASGTTRSFRIGKALYEQKFAYDIQAGVSAEQMYNKALSARDQLLARMDTLADELWPKYMGNAAKPADRTRKIGMVIDTLSRQHVAREQLFPEIRRQIPVLQEWVTRNNLLTLDPQKPLIVRETPVYQRGVAVASIEAPGPYRPQEKTYYNVSPLDGMSAEQAESTLREYNNWILQILNIHEAIPGHYAQLVYANKSPSLIKSLFANGAMIEGWAVYAERMMLESGYGDNTPEMWLMYSKWNLRTVANTILDYSVHVLGMSEAQAMDLLVRQAFQTQAEAAGKWQRAKLSQVQLTSYFSGYSEIMDLREQRKAALGARFSLKEFHEQFLGYGSAPVKVIRELMQ